jgi:hypothetical protein
VFHYTNEVGFKSIKSQVDWLFKASQPRGGHPKAAYFTTLPPGTKNLNKRLFVRGCADKTRFAFAFTGGDDLVRLPGGRGDYVLMSVDDYLVERSRQLAAGETDSLEGAFP